MELKTVQMEIPEGANIIVGQAHFIKTAEDLCEVLVNAVPEIQFGLAFCEASGPCLIRAEGNDDELTAAAIGNAQALGAGHTFVVLIRNAFPVNVLNGIKACREVCSVFCATANPVQAVVFETEQGRGVLGVIDGSSPKGVETGEDLKARRAFLRTIGYKL
ncbi:MAG: adenosine-specific kinase [Candidatus Latescibacterota bacterium]